MSAESIKRFVLSGSLLIILVLSPVSILKAQSSVSLKRSSVSLKRSSVSLKQSSVSSKQSFVSSKPSSALKGGRYAAWERKASGLDSKLLKTVLFGAGVVGVAALVGSKQSSAASPKTQSSVVSLPSTAGGPQSSLNNPFDSEPPTPTPEPLTMLLFGTGLVGVGAIVRRRRRSQQGE